MKRFVVVMLILLLSATGNAETKSQSVSTQTKQVSKVPKFSMTILSGDLLGPGYTGLPADKVASELEKLLKTQKGEFETTADYEARRNASISKPFLEELTTKDFLAFAIPIKNTKFSTNGLKYSFNADTGEISIYVMPTIRKYNGLGAPSEDAKNKSKSLSNLDEFIIDRNEMSRRTYQASNAYGATTTVEEKNMAVIGIAANRIPFLDIKRERHYFKDPSPVIQFKIENSLASKELPSLKALIVIKLTEPYIAYNFFHFVPTRKDPMEVTSQEKFFVGDVQGIVFYSESNGRILARFPDGFGKFSQPASANPSP